MSQTIIQDFRRAGLGLKFLGAPLGANAQIFQMDIHDGRSGEYFRIWPGARDNFFEVLDGNVSLRQVVLRVQEPRRLFRESFPRFGTQTREWARARAERLGGTLVDATPHRWIVERWTPDEERRYLCGRDESHLFIAQVREGSTVQDAHAALKPDAVVEAEGRLPGAVRRQGEWFFVPSSEGDIDRIRAHVATHPRSLRREVPLGRGGKPHVADSVVRLDYRARRGWREIRLLSTYVLGWVRHADHAPLLLETWHRVLRNAEVPQPTVGDFRVRWID